MRERILNTTMLVLTLFVIAQSALMARAIPRCVRLRHLIYVATTTPTLADITNQIGGRKVLVTPLLKANQDFANPKIYKSMKHTVREAEVFVRLDSDALLPVFQKWPGKCRWAECVSTELGGPCRSAS